MPRKISKKLRSKTKKFWQSPAWRFGIGLGTAILLISIVLFGNQIDNLLRLWGIKASEPPNFNMMIIDPPDKTRTVLVGEVATYTIQVTSINGFVGNIELKHSGLDTYPDQIDSAFIEPPSILVNPTTPIGLAKLTILTKPNSSMENINFEIIASSNLAMALKYDNGILHITDFGITVSSPSTSIPPKTIPGGTLVFNVVVSRDARFEEDIYARHNLYTLWPLAIKSVVWGNATIDPGVGVFDFAGANETTLTITLKNPIRTTGIINFTITGAATFNNRNNYRVDQPSENSQFKIILPKCKINNPAKPQRHTMILDDPDEYTNDDVLYLANLGIDVINWATGSQVEIENRMTPIRDTEGNYNLSQNQKDLILKLYCSGERIFWIGISTYHIDTYFPYLLQNPEPPYFTADEIRVLIYAETAKAIKSFTDYFVESNFSDAKVGIYTGTSRIDGNNAYHGFYTDEAIGWMHKPYPDWVEEPYHDGVWDWDNQFIGAIDSRQGIKDASTANGTWDKVVWFIAGMNESKRYNENPEDLTCPIGLPPFPRSYYEQPEDPPGGGELHTLCEYTLPNDANSYWAHYTRPGDEFGHEYNIAPATAINLAYIHTIEMARSTWQNIWWKSPACINGCKTLAWSDKPETDDPTDPDKYYLTEGTAGSKILTKWGKLAFFGAIGMPEIEPIDPQPIRP